MYTLLIHFFFTGGPDAPPPFTNLIRVKRIFPSQPAWESGQFQEGDILISAAGHKLSGLSLRQALDILRSSPPITTLCVCRPNFRTEPRNSSGPPNSSVQQQQQHFKEKPLARLLCNKRIRSYSFTPASLQQSNSMFCDEENYLYNTVSFQTFSKILNFSLLIALYFTYCTILAQCVQQ